MDGQRHRQVYGWTQGKDATWVWPWGLQKIFGQAVLRKGRSGLVQDCQVGGTVGDKGGCRRITRTLNVTVQSLDLIQ